MEGWGLAVGGDAVGGDAVGGDARPDYPAPGSMCLFPHHTRSPDQRGAQELHGSLPCLDFKAQPRWVCYSARATDG